MIVGIENLLAWYRKNDAPYWRLKSKTKTGAMIAQSSSDENLSINQGEQELRDYINLFSSGHTTLYVECWNTQGQRKNWFETIFEKQPQGYFQQGIAGMNPMMMHGYMSPQQVEDQIKRALDEYKKEQELQELKEIIEDLKNGGSKNKVWEMIEPYLPSIMAKYGLTHGSAVSGTGEEMTDEQAQKRVETALETWSGKDPDFIVLVEKIAKLCQTNPDMYKTAKGMLMSQ